MIPKMQMLECRWEGGAGLGNMKHSGQIGWRKAYMDFTPETFEKVENSFYLKQMYKEILHSTSTLNLHPLAFCACSRYCKILEVWSTWISVGTELCLQMMRTPKGCSGHGDTMICLGFQDLRISSPTPEKISWTSSSTLSLWTSPPAHCPSTCSGWC